MLIINSGKQGSGKTTLTNLLMALPGCNPMAVKFADPLYDMQQMVWTALKGYEGLPYTKEEVAKSLHDTVLRVMHKYSVKHEEHYENLYSYFLTKFGRAPESPFEKKSGDMLQYLGTEFGRALDPDIWVNIAKRRVQTNDEPGTLIIIDDCRFENEFYALDSLKPLKIRLECDRDVRKARADSWRPDEFHKSETSLDSIASNGEFDLYFDTQDQAPAAILKEVEHGMREVNHWGESSSLIGFTNVANKYYSKGFKQLDDNRLVGNW